MNRRKLLKLLGLAPAIPLAAKVIADIPPASPNWDTSRYLKMKRLASAYGMGPTRFEEMYGKPPQHINCRCTVVNTFDSKAIERYLQSGEGEKAIVKAIRANAQTIRGLV